jgi:hypothetical protein
MGIGLSNGAFYKDEMHYAASRWDDRYDDNVISPSEMDTNKQLDKQELDPSTGLGIEVNYKPDPSQIDVSRLTDIHSGGPPIPMPQVIAKTKAGDITNEDVDTAVNVGMGSGPGTIAGLNSLGSLAAEARGTLLSKLGHAQVLENGGVHPDDIYTTTGFFKGPEGKWRYEIGDKDAKFTPLSKDSHTLGEVLDHPELYKSYPELKDMTVHHDPELSGAYYDPNTTSITLGGKPYKNLLGEDVIGSKDKSTLMHEIQHAIQDTEGFAKGGTPVRAGVKNDAWGGTYKLKYQDDYIDYLNKNGPEMDRIYSKYEKANDPNALTDKEVAFAKKYQQVRDTYQKYRKEGDTEASTNYFKLAGENEARNVQNRMDLDEVARSNTPPRWTQDIPDKDVIVKGESSVATPYGAFTIKELNKLGK